MSSALAHSVIPRLTGGFGLKSIDDHRKKTGSPLRTNLYVALSGSSEHRRSACFAASRPRTLLLVENDRLNNLARVAKCWWADISR